MAKKEEKNILDYVPVKNEQVPWEVSEDKMVTIHMENRGVFARVAQKAFHKPSVSHIKLEKFGSFIWQHIDGNRSIFDIAQELKGAFGEEAEPLYDRILPYFRTLYGHNFIGWQGDAPRL